MEEDGTRFKVSYCYMPYFYILTRRELIQEVNQFLTKKFSGTIGKIEVVSKEDLDLVQKVTRRKHSYYIVGFSLII